MREEIKCAHSNVCGVDSSIPLELQKVGVTVATHFHRRWKAFEKAVLKNPRGPLSDVAHYAWRLEFQKR